VNDASPNPGHPGETWVVVPTYNERDNVRPFISALLGVDPTIRLLIVDDNSPDGTGSIADEIASGEARLSVLHRQAKAGLGAAYRAGFREVMRQEACARIAQMDCDFSHDPAELPSLLAALDQGADLVLGSRYVPGGSTPGWSLSRRVVSRMGSLVARRILSLPYRDLTGGFKVWRRDALAMLDLENGYAQGYGFQIETTWNAHQLGYRVEEVPITFRERRAGKSKMTGAIALEALRMVWRLRSAAPRVQAQPAAVRTRD
jgi:dolichol-phosphate mannosyltransferase